MSRMSFHDLLELGPRSFYVKDVLPQTTRYYDLLDPEHQRAKTTDLQQLQSHVFRLKLAWFKKFLEGFVQNPSKNLNKFFANRKGITWRAVSCRTRAGLVQDSCWTELILLRVPLPVLVRGRGTRTGII